MRLVGYIEEFKVNSFSIPVYSNDYEKFYCHNLDDFFCITNFEEIYIEKSRLKPVYLSKLFFYGDVGAVVFIGDKFKFCNSADLIVEDIELYLKLNTNKVEPHYYIKKEVLELKELLSLNKYANKHNVQDIRDYFVDYSVVLSNKKNSTGVVEYSLEEYLEKENEILESEQYTEDQLKFSIVIKLDSEEKLNQSNDYSPSFLNSSIEELLRGRSEERRKSMKKYNYRFNKDINEKIEDILDKVFRNEDADL